MMRKIAVVTALGAAGVALSAGVAQADSGPAFGGSTTLITGIQKGLVNINAPLVDLRCAAPWFGSAVMGGSLPLGMQAVVCDDVEAPVTQTHDGGDSLLP